ncbi:MAG: beta-ketoacyl-ACP synthase III, partial [Thermoanaerobaculia bacterium]
MSSSDGKVGILGLGAYVPERVMTNDDWARHVDTTSEWIVSRTGIETRHFAADDETTVDLAVAAARAAIADADLGPEDIDEIIVATDTPEVFSPDTAAFVQHELGARQVPAYDLAGSGCAGFVQALDVACSRVLAGRPEKVLVIGAEIITRLMDWKDRATCVLFGDAAGAAVLGRDPPSGEILAVETGTDGSRTGILGLPIGGTRQPFSLDIAQRGLHKQVVMHGREVFKEAVTRMSEASRKVLATAGRKLSEVALVVPHQANLRIISAVAKALDTPLEKVFINVREYGNTGSASVPLALAQARGQGRVRDGDLVLLTSFGAGFHWAAAL